MKPTYIPEQGSLPHRVLTWFALNPEEELTFADIARKFDVAVVSNVRPSLQLAINAGLLILFKDEKGQSTLRLGPAFDAWKATAGPKAVVPVRAHGGAQRKAPPPLLDLDAVEVKKGLIGPRNGDNAITLRKQMLALFARLQPDTRIELPLAYQYSIKSALTAYNRANPQKKLGITVDRKAGQVIVNRFV